MHHHRSLVVLASLAAGLSAQQLIETFSYPDGPVIPGWTAQASTWAIQGGRAVATGGPVWSYLTVDRFPNVAACAVDVDVFYPVTNGLHFGGVCARHPGGSGSGLVMAKVQDNSLLGAFNAIYLYEQPGSNTHYSLTAINSLAGTLRLIVKGRVAWTMWDGNLDGVFEFALPSRPFAQATTQDRGYVGIDGYNSASMDNFEFFDAVLMEDPTTPPRIGTTYKMTLTAEMNRVGAQLVPTPWTVALALGRAGIPFPDGRGLPLTFDPLFQASLSLGMSGVLLSPGVDGVASLPLPNDPNLVGLRVFAAGVTIDGSRPFPIGAISNDHSFVISG